MVEHAGELLDKDRLLAALWPGLVVEENSLSQSVSALRKALGDDAQQPRFVQTVPRRGFRFIAPVVASDSADRGDAVVASPVPVPLPLHQAINAPAAVAQEPGVVPVIVLH